MKSVMRFEVQFYGIVSGDNGLFALLGNLCDEKMNFLGRDVSKMAVGQTLIGLFTVGERRNLAETVTTAARIWRLV